MTTKNFRTIFLCILLLSVIEIEKSEAKKNVEAEQDKIQFVLGNDVWQPGVRYQNGDDWLGLSCHKSDCQFIEAKLNVKKEDWTGHYDDKPTAGQNLKFSLNNSVKSLAAEHVIAWIHKNNSSKMNWLKEGYVKTYASIISGLKKPPTKGSYEIQIDLPNAEKVTFVPLYRKQEREFDLQLRTKKNRQMLGALGKCTHEISQRYLVWAGDFDQDGRPDFIVSFVDDDGQAVIYLSSMAKKNEIVGGAGFYDAPPSGGECDG